MAFASERFLACSSMQRGGSSSGKSKGPSITRMSEAKSALSSQAVHGIISKVSVASHTNIAGVTTTLAAQGESCSTACANNGRVCTAGAFPQLNDCTALSGLLVDVLAGDPCHCMSSRGIDQPAVEEGSGGTYKCLIERSGAEASTCEASHPRTRRACPCIDAKSKS